MEGVFCFSLFLFGCGTFALVACGLVLISKRFRRKPPDARKLRIAFVHLDLGIGGAERLVVDAALALQSRGHEVAMYTARHEPPHCFEETSDGTLEVVVYGDWLPRRILGRFYAACAYLRMCWVAVRLVLMQFQRPFDVIFVDQVSVCIPILQLGRPGCILFYCHFPDKLLTPRKNLFKKAYRLPIDLSEELTTGCADIIFVNSKFTRSVFADAFPILYGAGVEPQILYPPLNAEEHDQLASQKADVADVIYPDETLLLSINRFERKKDLGLAIKAFAALPESSRKRCRLVLAGGYDAKLPENVEHAAELEALAAKLGVQDRVSQMRSINNQQKVSLIKRAYCLLYTPDREHFGIVPLEAMYHETPVIAVNTGGPLETIEDGATGFLRPPKPPLWADAVEKLLGDSSQRNRMGSLGRANVSENFLVEAFGKKLETSIMDHISASGRPKES